MISSQYLISYVKNNHYPPSSLKYNFDLQFSNYDQINYVFPCCGCGHGHVRSSRGWLSEWVGGPPATIYWNRIIDKEHTFHAAYPAASLQIVEYSCWRLSGKGTQGWDFWSSSAVPYSATSKVLGHICSVGFCYKTKRQQRAEISPPTHTVDLALGSQSHMDCGERTRVRVNQTSVWNPCFSLIGST